MGLALLLPGCGDEQTAATGGEKPAKSSAATKASAAKAKAPAVEKQCGRQLGEFLDSAESLDNGLAVGLSYRDYLGAVNAVRSTYASIEPDRLPIACLVRVAGPAERALNVYVGAANAWGDCLAAACDLEPVEPRLQHEWARASQLLAEAKSGLRRLH
jgi:hypothetical protein